MMTFYYVFLECIYRLGVGVVLFRLSRAMYGLGGGVLSCRLFLFCFSLFVCGGV